MPVRKQAVQRGLLTLLVMWGLIDCSLPCRAAEIRVLLPRHAYLRGETIPLVVECRNDSDVPLTGLQLQAINTDWRLPAASIPEIAARQSQTVSLPIDTQALRSGREYPLAIRLFAGDDPDRPLAEAREAIYLARPPNSQRLNVWQWTTGGPVEVVNAAWKTTPEELGFTVAGGPSIPVSPPGADPAERLQLLQPALERTLRRGMDLSLCAAGPVAKDYTLLPPEGMLPLNEGGEGKPPVADPADDVRYQGAVRNGFKYLNPFHPEVLRQQARANQLLVQQLAGFPNAKYAFLDAEFVDDLYGPNKNAAGQELLRRTLGFTREEIGPPRFVAKGVVADDDRGLRFRRWTYQQGNGVNFTLRRAAEAIHQPRPDLKFTTDPFRSVALLDMNPGCDLVSTWTYTNPDPKLMLSIETLRAASKPANQQPLPVVTLLNYPGTVVPETVDKRWYGMGAGRLMETTWINLSLAPETIGYYALDARFFNDDFPGSQLTFDAFRKLKAELFEPLGPLIRALQVSPRRIALLTSESSRLYGKSPALLGYPDEQTLHFASVLAMAHLNADVVFDETIERAGLDGYDVLVLPKCDVLTQSVWAKVGDFQRRGGVVLADQYLGADIPGAIRFDFDFTQRKKVNANAIATGKIYAGSGEDDHLLPGQAAMHSVAGVTARQDQALLESYAAQLRATLKGTVEPDVWCDQLDVLVNVLEADGVRYVVVINDRRDYDDRTGPYKAIMEKLVPQTATLHLRGAPDSVVAYDLIAHRRLPLRREREGAFLPVDLGDLGGTIVALLPAEIAAVEILAPPTAARGTPCRLAVRLVDAGGRTLPGTHPLRIRLTEPGGADAEYSRFAATRNGEYELTIVPALNDPIGAWTLHVDDLSGGRQAEVTIDFRPAP